MHTTNPDESSSAAQPPDDASGASRLAAALGFAIHRLAAGEAPPPVVDDPPFERARILAHLRRIGLDEPEVVDAVLANLPAGGMLAFLTRTEEALGSNAYLCAFLREAIARATDGRLEVVDPAEDPARAAALVDVLHYALVLDALVRLTTLDPTGDWCDRVDRHVTAKLATLPWQRHANLFQRLKILSVRGLPRWSRVKRGGSVGDAGMRWNLVVNVLEAMGEDRRLGCPDNAAAGLALAEGPFGWAPLEGLGNDRCHVDALGRQRMSAPLPKLWADLYTTWNLAFVSHYPAAPWFWAKLLIPSVAGYRDTPDLYLYHRAISLYLHIWYVAARKADGGAEGQVDWRNPELTTLWGDVNARSARDYSDRIHVPPLRAFQGRVRALWAVIRLLVRPGGGSRPRS